MDDPKLTGRPLWELLIETYADQAPELNHTKAAKTVGVSISTAYRIYHHGFRRKKLAPVREIINERQAMNRAVRGAAGGEPTLQAAQDDARETIRLEGQMIAAARLGVSRVVQGVFRMMEAMEPVLEKIEGDIVTLADDDPEDSNRSQERRALLRDILSYQRQSARLINDVMNLERKFMNEPTALVGVEVDDDIETLIQRAKEGAAMLRQLATVKQLEMTNVTPEEAKP